MTQPSDIIFHPKDWQNLKDCISKGEEDGYYLYSGGKVVLFGGNFVVSNKILNMHAFNLARSLTILSQRNVVTYSKNIYLKMFSAALFT